MNVNHRNSIAFIKKGVNTSKSCFETTEFKQKKDN